MLHGQAQARDNNVQRNREDTEGLPPLSIRSAAASEQVMMFVSINVQFLFRGRS